MVSSPVDWLSFFRIPSNEWQVRPSRLRPRWSQALDAIGCPIWSTFTLPTGPIP